MIGCQGYGPNSASAVGVNHNAASNAALPDPRFAFSFFFSSDDVRSNGRLGSTTPPVSIPNKNTAKYPTKLVTPSGETVVGSLNIFTTLNAIGRKHGIGRVDIVENRFIGIKSRGCYDSPAMTILRAAHVDLEGLVLDREVRSLRDQFVTFTWSKLLYNGLYFSPEREFIEKMRSANADWDKDSAAEYRRRQTQTDKKMQEHEKKL